nr:MAG TPA: hypothetical protein [Bacteriophage sp.]
MALWSCLRCCALRKTATNKALCHSEILRVYLVFLVISPHVPLSARSAPANYILYALIT